ncbi:MAG: GxxExxY protein [Bacteroidota bacterium]
MDINTISYDVIGCAYRVHSGLGPGLLESAYRVCLSHELAAMGYEVDQERILPVNYKGIQLNAGYRIDIVVANLVLVEIKAVHSIHPNHIAQTLTYLRLSGMELGLLLNFNERNLQNGIRRLRL